MDATALSLPTLTALRNHVRQTLSARDRLDAKVAELHEARILRSGKTCGAFYQVCGPRRLRTYAVWSNDEKRILYYESTGARFGETKLDAAPDPRSLDSENPIT